MSEEESNLNDDFAVLLHVLICLISLLLLLLLQRRVDVDLETLVAIIGVERVHGVFLQVRTMISQLRYWSERRPPPPDAPSQEYPSRQSAATIIDIIRKFHT